MRSIVLRDKAAGRNEHQVGFEAYVEIGAAKLSGAHRDLPRFSR
jgi:hypothetical protein